MTSEHKYGDGPRFFGRRRGKALRTGARALMETALPRLAFSLPPDGEDISLEALFDEPKRAFWLEIGFGGGEHLAWQAAHNPDVGLIGAEVFQNGIASFLGHASEASLTNVRIWPEDVRALIPCFPVACFERVFVLFPDPWPKKRHQDRRIVSQSNLDQIARLLVEGGVLRIGTDDETYKAWAIEQMEQRADFVAISKDTTKKPADWPATRYEMKALDAGRIPVFLEYQRCPR